MSVFLDFFTQRANDYRDRDVWLVSSSGFHSLSISLSLSLPPFLSLTRDEETVVESPWNRSSARRSIPQGY